MGSNKQLLDLPIDVLIEIFSHLGITDLAKLQSVNTLLFKYITMDSQFTYYNTCKFFDMYYNKNLLPVFLCAFINPRYSTSNNKSGNTPLHIIAAHGESKSIDTLLAREKSGYPHFSKRFLFNREAAQFIHIKYSNNDCELINLVNSETNIVLHFISILPEIADEARVISCARKLIRLNCNVWKKGRVGNTVLTEAVQHGCFKMVKMILKEACPFDIKKNINKANDYHENAVILAAREYPKILKLLLKYGGDPNSCRSGVPILSILASECRLDRRQPSDFDAYHRVHTNADNWDITFRMSSQKDKAYKKNPNHTRSIAILLKNGANPYMAESYTGMTPLQMAAFWGNISGINALIKLGNVKPNKDINYKTGWLAIHYACLERQTGAANCLIGHGANVDKIEGSQVPSPMEILGDASKLQIVLKRNRSPVQKN